MAYRTPRALERSTLGRILAGKAPAAAGKLILESRCQPAGTPGLPPSCHRFAAAGTPRRDSWYTSSPPPTNTASKNVLELPDLARRGLT
jgi:hypothetical protein